MERFIVDVLYETSTPSFLIDLIRIRKIDPTSLECIETNTLEVQGADLRNLNVINLLFQTGYLTIIKKEFQLPLTTYTLSFPNNEVRLAFFTDLIKALYRPDLQIANRRNIPKPPPIDIPNREI